MEEEKVSESERKWEKNSYESHFMYETKQMSLKWISTETKKVRKKERKKEKV